MKATRIGVDHQGMSFFDDFDIPLNDRGLIGQLSHRYPVKNILFRETNGNYHYDWHTAPEKQFILMLEGSVEIEVSSGEIRVFNTGDILLVEDTEGQGHLSKAVNGQPRKSVFITLNDEK